MPTFSKSVSWADIFYILGLCPCFSTSEKSPIISLSYESKQTKAHVLILGVSCSCFSIRTGVWRYLRCGKDTEQFRPIFFAMKKLLSFFLVLVCAMSSFAQTSMMATLNHEGTISTFYGTLALRQAHAAAVSGDVITLSSGTFLSTDITKAVTIRGAGMEVTKAYDIVNEPTVLTGNFKIKIPAEDTGRLTLEGIFHNETIYFCDGQIKNALFLKSRFKNVTPQNTFSPSIVRDLTVLNCRITDHIYVGDGNSAQFLNSVVNSFGYGYMSFSHCVILGGSFSDNGNEYKSCIITPNEYISFSSSAYNNLFISDITDFLKSFPNNTNLRVPTSDERFAYLRGYDDSKDYKLTDQNRDVLKATDGGEIGIYGGSLPYSAIPTNPQITKFNVASKTTADGKLSVDIEVKSGE